MITPPQADGDSRVPRGGTRFFAVSLPSAAGADRRLATLDVLRGVAVLGILLMNIQSFGLISSQYVNPKALGEPPPLDWLVWLISHLVADEKFIAMLTILFGAGLLLMAQHSRCSAADFEHAFRRRMGWLFLFGLAHGLLVWPGDILAAYAVCGLIVMHFRHLGVRQWLVISVLLFAGAMLLRALLGVGVMFLLPVEWIDSLAARYWTPSTSAVAAEVDRLTHDWVSAFGERVVNAVGAQLWMLTTDRLWRMTAMMCLGMALLQLGFLSGRWSMRAYGRVVVLGLGIGMPVVLLGVGLNEAAGWDFAFSWFLGRIFNHWGSVAISLAWLAGGIMLVKSGALQRTLSALQAVGRMALTNYLGQSLICGAIFYGFGLGLFSQLSHVELLGVVILVWAFQIAFSLLWQRHLGRGPFERVWRHLARSR